MTAPTTDATVRVLTRDHPHPGIPGGVLAAPTLALLRAAAADGIATADGISLAAAIAFYDARIVSGEWIEEPVALRAPFTRNAVKPIGRP